LTQAHRWSTAGAVLASAGALHLLGGQSRLAVPFAPESVTLAVVAGLLVGQAAAIAVWPVTPWHVWRSRRPVPVLVGGLAAGALGAIVVAGALVTSLSGVPIVAAWIASAGLAWLGLALTRDLATSWAVPLGLTMGSLVIPPSGEAGLLYGIHVATWYEAPPAEALVLPLLLAPVAAAACAVLLARR
jgi:hypothetical protein